MWASFIHKLFSFFFHHYRWMCCEASRSLTMLPQSTSPLTSSQSSHTTSCLLQLRPQQRSTTPPTAATNPGQDGGDSKWPPGGAAELRFSRNWTKWLISGVCPSSPMDLAQTSESQPIGMETDWRVFQWEINLADFLGDLSGFSAALLSTNTTCWRRRWTSFPVIAHLRLISGNLARHLQ